MGTYIYTAESKYGWVGFVGFVWYVWYVRFAIANGWRVIGKDAGAD